MVRLIRFSMIAALLTLATAGSAFATTYYVAANGSDSNNGTSKQTPWLHAPGMSTCIATCASTTINAGDSIILRGGDTWHFGNSGLSPFAGFQSNAWNFTRSGSSTGCNVSPASYVTTSCIYVGVDQTWYSGSAWARPILNFDNAVTNSVPSSCSYNFWALNPVNFSGSYIIVDNLEFVGWCWSTSTGNQLYSLVSISNGSELKNSYFHGVTATTAVTSTCSGGDCDEYWATNGAGNGSGSQYSRRDHNVFDNSDGTFGNNPSYGNCIGPLILGGGEIDHNYFNVTSNIVKYTAVFSFHDNLINGVYESPDGGTHGNIDELPPAGWTIDTYAYNNVLLKNWSIGETYDLYPGDSSSGKAGFIFNNVTNSDVNNLGGNCFLVEGNDSGGPGPFYYFNNTSTNACQMRNPGRGSNTATFENNHFINYSGSNISDFSSVTNTDDESEIWQSMATANGQGYTVGNNWAPTSSGASTVGAGAVLSLLFCPLMDNATAATACVEGLPATGPITYNSSAHLVTDNALVPRGTTWDVGAYQFSSSSAGQPLPPTSVQATLD
ncbi:MAG TPA: hypothetical protein VMB47_14315 [Candidatus Aquilonibacter sp.]|nr:hypothetical protein [Candidatus Aquilonibacter sp.]